MQQTSHNAYGPGGETIGEPSSGMAITGFVLSLLSWLCLSILGAIPGLILGIVALVRANEVPPRAGGKGFAIAAIAISGLNLLASVVMIPLMIGITLPAIAQARQAALDIQSEFHATRIAQALSMYSIDHDGAYPPHDAWRQALISGGYLESEILVSPRSDGVGDDYFFVPPGTGFSARDVLVYEDPLINADSTVIAFGDMSTRAVPQAEALQLLAGLSLPDGTPFAPHLLEQAGPGVMPAPPSEPESDAETDDGP